MVLERKTMIAATQTRFIDFFFFVLFYGFRVHSVSRGQRSREGVAIQEDCWDVLEGRIIYYGKQKHFANNSNVALRRLSRLLFLLLLLLCASFPSFSFFIQAADVRGSSRRETKAGLFCVFFPSLSLARLIIREGRDSAK